VAVVQNGCAVEFGVEWAMHVEASLRMCVVACKTSVVVSSSFVMPKVQRHQGPCMRRSGVRRAL